MQRFQREKYKEKQKSRSEPPWGLESAQRGERNASKDLTCNQTETIALFGQSGEVPPDATKGNRTRLGTEGARDFLLNFDHPQILFGAIVGKRHAEIAQEQQEGCRISLKAIKQVLGFGLFDSSSLLRSRGWGRRLSCQTNLDEVMIGRGEVHDDRGLQIGLASGTCFFYHIMAGQQMFFELACPLLLLVFAEKVQLSKRMGIAQVT